eukprot:SM000016S01957  [mRNA]  locus=s16:915666:920922:+ [translate_table: standard]
MCLPCTWPHRPSLSYYTLHCCCPIRLAAPEADAGQVDKAPIIEWLIHTTRRPITLTTRLATSSYPWPWTCTGVSGPSGLICWLGLCSALCPAGVVYRMRLSVSLQRSMAHALYLRHAAPSDLVHSFGLASHSHQSICICVLAVLSLRPSATVRGIVFRQLAPPSFGPFEPPSILFGLAFHRSMACALHLRAGSASGSGQGTHFQEPSFSDLRLLSRASSIVLGLASHSRWPDWGCHFCFPARTLCGTLPIGKGGLGCRSLAHLASAAHLGCWAQVASTVSTRFIRRSQPVLAPAIAGVANGTLPFQTSLSDVRRDLLRSFPSHAADQVDFAAFSRAANERAMSHLKALLKEDGRGLSRLHSISSPGASEWLNALPIYESLRLSDDLFRTAVHHHLGLPPLCLAGIRQCECGHRSEDEISLAAHMLQCFEGSECNAPTIFSETLCMAWCARHAAMEVPGIMPVLQKRGRPYVRRLDVVATPRSGGPRLLLDVILIDAFQPGAPTPTVPGGATHHAERKERNYNDHPRGDHLFPCAMDIYGDYGTKWSSLLHHLALHVDARRRSRAGSLWHSSVPQAIVACYRMRLSSSLQRSQALAIHQRAGRALAQANGFRGGGLAPQSSLSDMHGTRFQEPSLSDLRLLSRVEGGPVVDACARLPNPCAEAAAALPQPPAGAPQSTDSAADCGRGGGEWETAGAGGGDAVGGELGQGDEEGLHSRHALAGVQRVPFSTRKRSGGALQVYVHVGAYRTGPDEFNVTGSHAPSLTDAFGDPAHFCIWAPYFREPVDKVYLRKLGVRGTPLRVKEENQEVEHMLVKAEESSDASQTPTTAGTSRHAPEQLRPCTLWWQRRAPLLLAPPAFKYSYCGPPMTDAIHASRVADWLRYHDHLMHNSVHYMFYLAEGSMTTDLLKL